MSSDKYLEAWQEATGCSDAPEHYTKATLEKYLPKLFEEKKFSGIDRTRAGRVKALRALWDECGDALKISRAVGSALTHESHALKYVFGCLKRFPDDKVEPHESTNRGTAGDEEDTSRSPGKDPIGPAVAISPPSQEPHPAASPQLEDGYLRIANEVVVQLIQADLGTEFSLIMAVLRQTWGWNRKEAKISTAELCLMIKRPKSTVDRVLRALVRRNILTESKGGGRGIRSEWGFNKNWKSWLTVSQMRQLINSLKDETVLPTNSPTNETDKAHKWDSLGLINETVSDGKSLSEQEQQPPKDKDKDIYKDREIPPIIPLPAPPKEEPLTEQLLFEIWNAESGELRKITTYMTQLKKVTSIVEFFNQNKGNGTGAVHRWTEFVRHAAKTIHPEHRGFIEPVWIGKDLLHVDEILENKYAHSFKGEANGKGTRSRKGHIAGDRADWNPKGPTFSPKGSV
jgi:phage replication O-like protein O